MDQPAPLTPLEKTVLRQFALHLGAEAQEADAWVNALRAEKREYTGVGFYVDLAASPPIPAKLPLPPSPLKGVSGNLNAEGHPVGFLLYLQNGQATCLECHQWAPFCWPSEISSFEVGPDPLC